jgi:hypothetical protein
LMVKLEFAPAARLPPVKVRVQLTVVPAVIVPQLTVLPVPFEAEMLVRPAGNASEIVAVAPLAVPPLLVTVRVYVMAPLVRTVLVPVFAKVKLAGVFTVVERLAQLLVPQPLPGVGAVPPVVVATEA